MRTVVLTVPAGDSELAADTLWRRGVPGVEERDAGGGRVELRAVVGDGDRVVARLAAAVPPGWSVADEECAESVSEAWRDHVRPTVIADSVMTIPSWLDVTAPPGVTAVRIEPAGAFGLGDHPTTVLSIEHLVTELDRRPSADVEEVADVADIGCGSGILGIVALLRGARSVRAVDVSGAAVEATRANADRNGIGDRLVVDTASASDLEGEFEIVIANILAPVLVSLAPTLRRLVAPDGVLIVSGLLADRAAHVVDALQPLTVTRRTERDGWCALTLRREAR